VLITVTCLHSFFIQRQMRSTASNDSSCGSVYTSMTELVMISPLPVPVPHTPVLSYPIYWIWCQSKSLSANQKKQ